jgi:SpoVK/Ycf46/Vps4 family AAA+-type ATPase
MRGKELVVWSITEGFEGVIPPRRSRNQSALELDMALDALDYILKWEPSPGGPSNGAIFVLKDFDPFIAAPSVERKLRDVARALKATRKTVIILSPVLKIPSHLEKTITVVDYPLPTFEDLKRILENMVRQVQDNPNVRITLEEEDTELFVKAALGLTAEEAESVFAKALVKDGRLERMDVQEVLSEKKQIIRKTGILEYYETDIQFNDVGGLDLLKDWLRKRKRAFTEKARAFGLPEPRGMLLIGVQGCGKSLTAKAVASLWELPLLRFDVGSVFAKYVGESEANIRKAIQVAESIAPCVLWIDELEKGFSHMTGGEDSGTSARVFAYFLTWLQEKTSPVFVVCTANDVHRLPPELLRKGRLDEIFFIDLPTERERREIFEIHLRRRNRRPEDFDLDRLAQVSEGFSGSEIEQAIIAALYDAFEEEREVTTEDIVRNIQLTVPLSQTMREQIQSLREWARTRARQASSELRPV